jgi:hypothetical protein
MRTNIQKFKQSYPSAKQNHCFLSSAEKVSGNSSEKSLKIILKPITKAVLLRII